MSVELESQSQSTPSSGGDTPTKLDFGCGDGGRRATLMVRTNQDTDFTADNQENELPSPMNWDNLNRIIHDIERELQQKNYDGNRGELQYRRKHATMPLSPISRDKINDMSDSNSTKNENPKTMISTLSPAHNDSSIPTSNQTPPLHKILTSKETVNDGCSKLNYGADDDVGAKGHGNKERASSTITMTQSQRDYDSPEVCNGQVTTKEMHDLTDTRGDDDKEKAVNALIQRMFAELALEMAEESRLDHAKVQEVAERIEIEARDKDEDTEIIDVEARDPTENAEGDISVTGSDCCRDATEEEAINDGDHHDVINHETEGIEDEWRVDADAEERTRKALENAVIAAAAELERRREEDNEIQMRLAEEKKRMLSEERNRKEQLELVKSILHANCENDTNSYYKVLGVLPTCSAGNIKKAYRKLALKLHPDKEKYNTPKADEAFKAVSHAYDILKDDALRNEYDQTQNRSVATPTNTSAPMSNKGPTIPITLPNGTRITIQSKDIRFAHFNGLQGCVVSYDDSTDLYTIQIDGHCTTTKSKITALFRNVIVCLRAAKANELGVFVATLVSYYKDDKGGLYQARYNGEGGKRGSVYLRSEQFIVPNGTVVGLQCGNYGTIVDWREEIDQYTRADVSYYKVQLYNEIFTRVPMKNIRL